MSALAIIFEEEFTHLHEIAVARGWPIEQIDGPSIRLILPSRLGECFGLEINCLNYPTIPPAFHWRCLKTGQPDLRSTAPKGGGFFHGNGVICAPWNRLAYSEVDSRGPHTDWTLATWKTNKKTGEATTLSAMVLRVAFELMSTNLTGRL